MEERNHYAEESLMLEQEEWDVASRPNFFVTQDDEEVDSDTYFSRPGRFRSPVSLWDKFYFFSQRIRACFVGGHDNKEWHSFLKRYMFPYRWEVLFRYLFREGIGEKLLPEQCVFYYDQPKMISYRLGLQNREFGGRGNGSSVELALSKTVGESLERFFLSSSEKRVSTRSSIAALRLKRARFLHPRFLTVFSEAQRRKKSYRDFNEESIFRWTWCRHLDSGKQVLVPSQCIFFDSKSRDQVLLREANSNGGAGGFSIEEALLSALYELVERDGFIIHWLLNEAPAIIDVAGIHDVEFNRLYSDLSRCRLEAVFLNITTDIGIPSCACILINRSVDRPYGLAVGCASGFRIEEILRKSLEEALMVFGSISPRDFYPELSTDYVSFSDSHIGLRQRMHLWRHSSLFNKILPWLDGEKHSINQLFGGIPVFRSFQEEYDYVLNVFRTKGYEVFYYNVEDKRLNKLGYFVVRALIPKLVPFYLTESNAPLGSERLRKMFDEKNKSIDNDVNSWPHPLA